MSLPGTPIIPLLSAASYLNARAQQTPAQESMLKVLEVLF